MAPALRPPDQVEPADGAVSRSIRHRRVALAGTKRLRHPVRSRAPEHDNVEQRIGAEPVDEHRRIEDC
jgi:hypothetical protein